MTIVRSIKTEHTHVQIDKRCLEDTRLSWKSKGILAYLMADTSSALTITSLEQASKDGKSAIRSAIKELVEYGYLPEQNEVMR